METLIFEKLLKEEISESIKKDEWIFLRTNKIMRKKDSLSLEVEEDSLKILEPNEYTFTNKKIEKYLVDICKTIYSKLEEEESKNKFDLILKSLSESKDEWETSIWGIKNRKIDIELEIDKYDKKANIRNPHIHYFKEKESKILFQKASETMEHISKRAEELKMKESRENLKEFFKFDSRKAKLKIIDIKEEENKEKEELTKKKIEKLNKRKESIFENIVKNIFL